MTTCQYGNGYVSTARKLTADDVHNIAQAAALPELGLRTLMAVETGGHGFDPYGRPIILYEPHVMYRVAVKAAVQGLLAKLTKAGLAYPDWGEQPYPPGQDAQYKRLDAAAALAGKGLAVQACSWGLGQMLGENYGMLHYATPMLFLADTLTSEATQLSQIVRYLQVNNLEAPLRECNWQAVAKGYNGEANMVAYAAKLSVSYKQLQGMPALVYVAAPGRVTASAAPNILLHPAAIKPPLPLPKPLPPAAPDPADVLDDEYNQPGIMYQADKQII